MLLLTYLREGGLDFYENFYFIHLLPLKPYSVEKNSIRHAETRESLVNALIEVSQFIVLVATKVRFWIVLIR